MRADRDWLQFDCALSYGLVEYLRTLDMLRAHFGTFWSVVMMLEHLGEADAAARVMNAIEHVTADPALHTADLGGQATTAQVTQAVCAELARGTQRKAA